MKNLINFFFSFDKLFKEKLVAPFFWLALITWGLGFFSNFLDAVRLGPLAGVVDFIQALISVLFALVLIRLLSELAIAAFRINDNLSPDKGKSESANIDIMGETRKAAEIAAARTREATKTVGAKASEATKSLRDNVDDMSETVQEKAKAASASVKHKTEELTHSAKDRTESIMGKGSVPKPEHEPTPVKILEPSAPKKRGRPAGSTSKTKTVAVKKKTAVTKTATPKKRGRPAGSKNKTTAKKTPTKKAPAKTAAGTTAKKRGPKPGAKIPRDADGNLLKKDGTPRKKPGRKPKS